MSAHPSLDVLHRLQPMAALSEDRLRGLIPQCTLRAYPRGGDPLRQDDWRGQVVYLLHGQLKTSGKKGVRVMVGGHGQALMPLASGESAPESTQAITEVELLGIGEDVLDILVTWSQLAEGGMDATSSGEQTDWRMMSGMFAVSNLTQGAFAVLPPAHIQSLLGRFQRVAVRRGDVVIRQGDPGDYYYLIERGRCKVARLVAGASVQLAELRAGDAFGEEALVADAARNATVTMLTDGELLRLDKRDFDELLRAPLLQKLGPDEAQRRIDAGALWIDVRFPAEYQADGLPGAINIPLNDIRLAATTLDPAKEYIVYCQTGRRSSAAAFLLSQRGLRAALLDGGLRARAGNLESAL